MKINLVLALTLLSLQVVQATTYTYDQNWDIDHSNSFSGHSSGQTFTDSATDNETFSFFNGSGTLSRVRIIYSSHDLLGLQSFSPIMTGAMSVSAGTSHFSNAALSAETTIGSQVLHDALVGASDVTDAAKFAPKGFDKISTYPAEAFNLSSTDPAKSFSVTRDYTTTIFDSTDPAVLALFSQSGTFDFQLTSTVQGSFSRQKTDPGSVIFDIAGQDAGTMEVIYDAVVPEPGTVFAVGFLGLLSVGGFVREKIKALRS